MYKIGTGENGTVAGKVYLFNHSEDEAVGHWVHCKGKLYLRRGCDEPGLIRTICPETFQKTGALKLPFGDAFKDSVAAKFNRSFPLLSDGENLFAIIVAFKNVKRKVKAGLEKELEDMKKVEEEAKKKDNSNNKKPPPKRKEDKKQQPSENAKICDFYLVEFDISKHQEESEKPVETKEEGLVEELFEGFSGYFTRKECLKALRTHSNDIENASRWLLDEGECERVKVVIREKRRLLLAQSEVQEGRESDVVEDSVISPFFLSNGQWTMNSSQVTLHLNTYIAKVFSTKDEDVKAIDVNAGMSLIGPKQKMVINNRNNTYDDEDEEDDNGEEQERRREQRKRQSELVAEYFEKVELKGTFICSMPAESLEYERSAVSYSPSEHKFYILSLDSSSISTLLEYGDFLALNTSTMPAPLKSCYEKRFTAPSTPLETAQALLNFLKETEGQRYSLPWKWNSWDTLYQKMHELLASRPVNPDSESVDEKKLASKLARLKQRAEKFKELQQEKWLQALKINDTSELSLDLPRIIIPSSNNRGRNNAKPRPAPRAFASSRGRGRPRYIPGDGRRPPVFDDNESDGNLFLFPSDDFGITGKSKGEVKKDIQFVKKNLKEPAFCTAGSWTALKLLLNQIKKPQSTVLLLHLYDQLLIWTLHCGVLCGYSNAGCPELIEELTQHLVSIIKGEVKYATYHEEVQSYAWRIMIYNWQTFVRTAELQSYLFQEAAKRCIGNIGTGSYYQVMLSPNSSPFELFCCKYWKYPASFYPDYAFHQSHVQTYQLTVKVFETDPAAKKRKLKQKIEFMNISENDYSEVIEKYRAEEYLPKIAALLLPACKEAEKYSFSGFNTSLDALLEYYSGIKVPEDKSTPAAELEKHKETLLKKLRLEQNIRVEQNWKTMQEIVLSKLNGDTTLGWLMYNQIILRGIAAFYKDSNSTFEFVKKVLDTIEYLVEKFKEITDNYKNLQKDHLPWVDKLFEHLFWVSNYMHVVDSREKFALNIVPSLLQILPKLTELCQSTVNSSLLELDSKLTAESIDYTRTKVFETSHPYGRKESSRREVFSFPGAIAISCELDKRCRTESSNDSLAIYSNENSRKLYSYLGNRFSFSGKRSTSEKCIIVGSTVHADFQVRSHPQRSDAGARWGFKVTFRPIYGQTGKTPSNELTPASTNENWDGKFPEPSAKKLLSSVRSFVRCVAKLSRRLIRGVDLIPEEIKCKEFFELPLVKEGLKLLKAPMLIEEEEKHSADPIQKQKKTYKLHEEVVDPAVLKAFKESEEGKGWLVEFLLQVRKVVKAPISYEIEKKRLSFEKSLQNKWAHAERLCVLALLYHMGYKITENGVQIDEQGVQKIGQSLNEILNWMLKRLVGVKEYHHLKLAFLEECANCYEKFQEKVAEEQAKKADAEKAKPAEVMPAPPPKRKAKVAVSKSRSKRKKVVNLPSKPVEAPVKKEEVPKKADSIKISQLPLNKKVELKSKMYDKVYDMFLQRYQGNADLLKSLSEALKIKYEPKDQPETQRKIFIKLQDSLKDIVNLESPENLPDEIPLSLPSAKSPYEEVADKLILRATFLFELHNTERKEKVLQKITTLEAKSPTAKSLAEESDPFAELMLVKTQSMQPFLQEAQTPVQIKKAVEDYLKWKRLKNPVDNKPISDGMVNAVITVVTSNYSPVKLRKSLKVQEKRGLLRELGLKYLLQLTKQFGVTKPIVGSITRSLFKGPFSYIEGCSPAVTRAIIDHSMRLCVEIMNSIGAELVNFEKLLTDTIKKLTREKTDRRNRATHIKTASTQMKEILYLLSDFIVVLQGSNKNSIMATLCEASDRTTLRTFLSKVISIMLTSQKYLAELGYASPLSQLSISIDRSCMTIFGKFFEFLAEGNLAEPQKEVLGVLLSFVENERNRDDTLEVLLRILYEALVSFANSLTDEKVLKHCATVLQVILETNTVPCIIRSASKCALLVYKGLPADTFVNSTVQKIGKIAMLKDYAPTEVIPEDREYYVVLHLNSTEDNPIFVLTALYHLENLHPSFTESYPKSLQDQAKKDKSFKGPFDGSPLFSQNVVNKVPQGPLQKHINSSALHNISRQFDEIVRLTQEEPKEGDSEEEKMRKLDEKNFNRRISQHFSDAKTLCTILLSRSFVQFPISMTHKKATEVAALFEKAYNGQLESIPINPHMKSESKNKKLTTGSTVAASYPLTPKQPKNAPTSNFAIPPPIIIAKGRLVVSLCEKSKFEATEAYLNNLSKGQSNTRKSIQNAKYIPFTEQTSLVGSAYSISIEEFVNLLKDLLSAESKWGSSITKCVNQAFTALSTKKWKDIAAEDKESIVGTLILVSGWLKCIRSGVSVEAVVNNSKELCTVVSGGFGTGSKTVGVVVKGDDTLTVHNIPLECIKSIKDQTLHGLVDEESLIKALLNVHEECVEKGGMMEVIRLLLLKIATEMQWQNNSEYAPKLLEMLSSLSKDSTSEIIKQTSEERLAEAWERLIEKYDPTQSLFYIPRSQKPAEGKKEKPAVGKLGGFKNIFEYVQPMSSYLRSLPNKKADSHSETEAALKLLNYWEKHIIPWIQDMVKNAYKPWENLYYFEQLRGHLRNGDIEKAMVDSLVMCEGNLPGNCVLPKDNRDWSTFISDECIAGTWANAKVELGKTSANPVIASILRKRLTEFPALVKAVDLRIQGALCEYFDPETSKKLTLLLPIDSLKEQERPLPLPSSAYTYSELVSDFSQNLKDLTASLALRTFVAMCSADEKNLKAKTVADIIHWTVTDELKEDSVEGWVKHTKPILELCIGHSNQKHNKNGLISKVMKAVNRLNTTQIQSNKLVRLEEQIKELAKQEDLSEIMNIQEWCINTWGTLSINENTVSLSLTEASEAFAKSDPTLFKGKDGNVIFPLHEPISNKSDSGACIITFEIPAFLSPNSKLKFYSDPLGHCLVSEINVGKTPMESIPPIVINHGKVWCHFHQGTTANLSVDAQKATTPSSLPCCVTFIPATWTTACWLAETLTTALLDKAALKTIDSFYKPLVKTICNFVQKSAAPSILRQLSFVLINRILRKMRYIYNVNPYVPGSCLEKLGLEKDWLKQLVEDINRLRDNEDIGEESTYSEFIQNAAELVASVLLPFNTKGVEEKSDIQLIEQLKLPDWMHAVLNVAIFLNYFSKEGQLTKELLSDVFNGLSLGNQHENIVLAKNLPQSLNRSQLKEELVKILKEMKVRMVNLEHDIVIPENKLCPEKHLGTALIITNGFDLGYERVEKNEKGSPESPEQKVEEVEEEKEEIPSDWTCPACTFINPTSIEICQMCDLQRPAVLPEPEPRDSVNEKPCSVNVQEDLKIYESMMWDKLIEKIKGIGGSKGEEEKAPSDELKKGKEEKKDSAKEEEKKTMPESLVEVLKGSQLFEPHLDELLLETLRNRLYVPSKEEFLPSVQEVIGKIFTKMLLAIRMPNETLLIPREHTIYTSAGLEKQKVQAQNVEAFMKAIHTMAHKNPWMVWELFAHYGYDLWLAKGGYFSVKDLPEGFATGLLEDMITMCEVDICKETKIVMHMAPNYLRFSPITADPLPMINGIGEPRLRMKYPHILSHPLDEIRYNWSVLKKFNDYLIKAVPYINWAMCVNMIPENSVPLTVSSFLSSSRKLCLNYVKMRLQQAVLNKTAVVRETPPKMVFERLKLGHDGKKEKDHENLETLSDSMFYRGYEQIKKIDLTLLRPQKPEGSAPFVAFEIIFKGEYVVGEGGPYRQFFADISAELQPSPSSPGFSDIFSNTLRLLCPTPNTVNKQGDAKDKFTFTPSAKSTHDLLLYEYLGILMGCCMRTGVRLSLDLPSIIWKQIVQEPLTLADLEEVDNSVVGVLRYITEQELTPEEFTSIFTETFTAMLSDTSSIELLPDGESIPVTYDRREEYAELLLKARLNESSAQCKAIRKGISLVIPEAMLNFLTHQEIASLICGKPLVDLEMLKRHTRYGKGLNENSDRVKFLWEVLGELSETDKLRFIKFCWGQERLPANDEEYERQQVRFMIKPAMRKGRSGNEEDALPKADTCFFNLEIPNYKTKEKLKEKLMLAIYTDFVSMNAEDNPALDPRFSGSPMLDDEEEEQRLTEFQ
eukprot:TRINITY_DN1770_c0_g1_i1.p1 TRINITY_DN1770_c0_g1~~TRINITY_DN1770_c0_g1_i1.p1  ORF type:complete len:4067 (-),score=523.08 TRINITY_DN1770_c0_g1_i1:62-12262(-)